MKPEEVIRHAQDQRQKYNVDRVREEIKRRSSLRDGVVDKELAGYSTSALQARVDTLENINVIKGIFNEI